MINNLSELFNTQSKLIFEYLENKSHIAIILIDREGNILDCNKGLLNALGLKEKPITKNISSLLSSALQEIKSEKNSDFSPCILTFVTAENIFINLSGYICPLQNNFALFLEHHRITYSELLDKMSKLNNELAIYTREVDKKNRELIRANETIKRIMNTDPLTKLLNRRAFTEHLKRAISFSKRHRLPLSIIMADLDNFKAINDTYGHAAGDRVLKAFARIFKKNSRTEDIICRFGGEEFIILLPNTNISSAMSFAERLRSKFEKTKIRGIPVDITASFGLSELTILDNEESFIKRAEDALYEAKKTGKNGCVTIPSEFPPISSMNQKTID